MSNVSSGEYDAFLNGNRIHYSIRGSGPPLIAHSGGPGMDARLWDNLAGIDAFATVIIIHPRGSGLSDAPADGAYALADYVDDIEALRCHLNLEKPTLLGWSHGAAVAQQYARMHPGSLSRLILHSAFTRVVDAFTDPEGALVSYKEQPWYEESIAALKRWWSGDCQTDEEMTEVCRRAIKFYFFSLDTKAMQYLQRINHLTLRLAPLAAFWMNEAPNLDIRSGLQDIRVPSLVLVGQHDFITPVAMSREIVRGIPDCELEIFEESGHFAHVEEPERFYQVIKQFVLDEKNEQSRFETNSQFIEVHGNG
ncbi:MAG: alpha/beta hydrolase [Oceanospirillaceae bacterium]|nr:alpha/beta hydrolase [Oceanospirillaceae bacterium]